MIKNQILDSFLTDLASAKPTPGGGSAAAVSGAMGAALVSMVANLTIGKKGYEEVESEMTLQLQEAEQLRSELILLINEDVESFNQLMASYKLPKSSDEEKSVRVTAIQTHLKNATRAPLKIAQSAFNGLKLCQRSVKTGNKMVISDVGVAVEMLIAALKSAALNVYINAPSISDQSFKDIALKEIETLLRDGAEIANQVFEDVKNILIPA
ncbi:MAG: hypothetical protein B7Z60_02280 [Ferrovum sp. 37-45-19]|uniref:cyclodeaminase/cyclohydrolase family protein n=1 Tax=Ferrovum sp. JA12 TaxID=1356299 RepID=UPI0007037F15|nr:cyclodeaminase/cyclohydrolase family protein [Ferrovum sp. JA12]OYV80298.1 MAG: hypothetical protein B7Z65_01785 [Ferrovum sp. 21-44-67]OYV95044.1 MAG: hypothetical protein B7Z60_02280 [Ferrovum sp. 37-45-19]OZB32200.1 MAG: hypothetical protein B7X47_07115 [Ferrovum sp. 34-44-207]HQT80900.1 cyclodeaminase/cyclohydrolase family protein [Ferrovaceae bacterium]KRH78742.1 methenyltetrahydrofolate cyclohydrolase [Ferrovum sp. JA12]